MGSTDRELMSDADVGRTVSRIAHQIIESLAGQSELLYMHRAASLEDVFLKLTGRDLMDLLTEPLGYAFFRQGLAVSILVGLLCGLIGVYVVLRHMSYIGHGLSHAVFGGAVVAYVASVDFYLGAGAWGFAAALESKGRMLLMRARRLFLLIELSFAMGFPT